MPDAIHYCDRCGRIILPGSVAEGSALIGDDISFCENCSKELPPEKRAQISDASTRLKETPRRRPSSKRLATPPPLDGEELQEPTPGVSPTVLAGVFVGAGILVGVAVALVMRSGANPPPGPGPTPPPIVHTGPSPVPGPGPGVVTPPGPDTSGPLRNSPIAAGLLSKAEQAVKHSMDRYTDERASFQRVIKTFPRTHEAVKAVSRIPELDAEFSQYADAELAKALAGVKEHVAANRLGMARVVVNQFQARFPKADWYSLKNRDLLHKALGQKAVAARDLPVPTGNGAIDLSKGLTSKGMHIAGHATIDGGAFRPTRGERGQAGAAYLAEKVRVTNFVTRFRFRVRGNADGIAFIFQNDRTDAVGKTGAGLGCEDIANAFGVGLNYYGSPDRLFLYHSGKMKELANLDPELKPENGHLFEMSVSHVDGKLIVTLTDTETGATMTEVADADIAAFCGAPVGWAGFTGSTGGGTSLVDISAWTYAPLSPVGPVAHYTFDEKTGGVAGDSSGHGRHGTLKGEASWAPEDGRIGGALRLDGNGSYVELPALGFKGNVSLSMTAWMRYKSGGRGMGNIFGFGNRAQPNQVFSLRMEGAGRLALYFWSNDAKVNVPNYADKWVHVAATYDAATRKQGIYFNGKRATERDTDLAQFGDTEYRIGGFNDEFFEGDIDDVRIYDHALTEARVQALFAAGDSEVKPQPAKVSGTEPQKDPDPKTTPEADPKTTKVTTTPPPEPETYPEVPLPRETGMPGQWAPGLIMEIYDSNKFTKRTAAFIQRSLQFNPNSTGVRASLKQRVFGVRLKGWLMIPVSGEYSFKYDGRWLRPHIKLDGETLSKEHIVVSTRRKWFAAGLHPLEFEGHTDITRLSFSMDWARPESPVFERIPGDVFYHEVPTPGTIGPPIKYITGMRAELYRGEQLGRKPVESYCSRPRFGLGKMPYCTLSPPSRFSMKLTARWRADRTAEWFFRLQARDGVTLHIDDKEVVNAWSTGSGEASTRVTAGYHNLALQFRNRSGDAQLVAWQGMKDGNGNIRYYEFRAEDLYIEPGTPTLLDRDGLAPGLETSFYAGMKRSGKALATQIEHDTYFNWGGEAPHPLVSPLGYTTVAKGLLLVPKSGAYIFDVDYNGITQVRVNRQVIAASRKTEPGSGRKQIRLRAGRVPISISFTSVGEAKTIVHWTGPDFPRRGIGPAHLAHKTDKLPIASPTREKPEPEVIDTAEPTRQKPLVLNPGFEFPDRSRFAAGWKGLPIHDVLVRRATIQVVGAQGRMKSKALAMRRPDPSRSIYAYTVLSRPLMPGKYELSYWVRIEGTRETPVSVSLCGIEKKHDVSSNDWTQFLDTIDIPIRVTKPVLRVWPHVHGTRVFFDDIQVKPN